MKPTLSPIRGGGGGGGGSGACGSELRFAAERRGCRRLLRRGWHRFNCGFGFRSARRDRLRMPLAEALGRCDSAEGPWRHWFHQGRGWLGRGTDSTAARAASDSERERGGWRLRLAEERRSGRVRAARAAERAAVAAGTPPNSFSRYSAVILSSELEGTLAAVMPNALALARTSLLSIPSFFAMS